jgi:hypothetical protein
MRRDASPASTGLALAIRRGRAWATAVVDVHDVCLLVGLALLWSGLWAIWRPLPFVVVGTLLVWLALAPPPLPPGPPPSAGGGRV